jgi:hypothetical protein
MVRFAYDRLCLAVQKRDETAITRAANDLTFRGMVTDAELQEHYDRINTRLNGREGRRGLSEILKYKQNQFKNPSKRPKHVKLNNLIQEIDALSDDIRILSRLLNVVGNEIRRRGELVSAMTEERPYLIEVHA